jgi:hypothetical protein
MWSADVQSLNSGTRHVSLRRGGEFVAYRQVLRDWQHDEPFRAFFIELLCDMPFAAFKWETPPLTHATAARPFEWVVLDAPGLARTPDPHAFAGQFRAGQEGAQVLTFPNLGGDALLVVPVPAGPPSAYPHLAAFLRKGPDRQKHALWRAAGAAVEARLSDRPVWLSTAGMGVAWLHLRLDSSPKYYGYRPYAHRE